MERVTPGNIRIAGSKTVSDWLATREKLKKGANANVWLKAFDEFFKERLMTRYFAPIRALEKMKIYAGEGFSIVALQCSLVEFLASTLEGKSYRYRRGGDPQLEEFEYSDSKEMFVSFLRERTPFQHMFRDDISANDFYVAVRCGLLHEARTKNGWRIIDDPAAAQAIDTSKRLIYRDKMQAAFDEFVDWYRAALPADSSLQQAFIRKFDGLCTG